MDANTVISPIDALAQLRRSHEPICASTFAKAERALGIIQTARMPTPSVFPTSEGGIQFAWRGPDRELNILVLPDSDRFAYATCEAGESIRQGEEANLGHLLVLLNWRE